jgi:hypothetical protein
VTLSPGEIWYYIYMKLPQVFKIEIDIKNPKSRKYLKTAVTKYLKQISFGYSSGYYGVTRGMTGNKYTTTVEECWDKIIITATKEAKKE